MLRSRGSDVEQRLHLRRTFDKETRPRREVESAMMGADEDEDKQDVELPTLDVQKVRGTGLEQCRVGLQVNRRPRYSETRSLPRGDVRDMPKKSLAF